MGGGKSSSSSQNVNNTIGQGPTNAYSSPMYGPLTQVMQQTNAVNGSVGQNLNYSKPNVGYDKINPNLSLNTSTANAPSLSYLPQSGVKAANPSNFNPLVQNSISQQVAGIKANQANTDRSLSNSLSMAPGNNSSLLNALRFQGKNAAAGAMNAIYPQAFAAQQGINQDTNAFNLQSQNLLQQLVGQNNQQKLSAADQQMNFINSANAAKMNQFQGNAGAITANNSAGLNAANMNNTINQGNNSTKLNSNQVQLGGQNQLLNSILQMIQLGSGKVQTTEGTESTTGKEKKSFI